MSFTKEYLDTVSLTDEGDYGVIAPVYIRMLESGEKTDFSANNRKHLLEHLTAKKPKCIVEIGVENNEDPTLTSTSIILNNKLKDTTYIGVDLLDRKHLDNEDENIHTIKINASDIEGVMAYVNSFGFKEIDFLFIDGWHSITQCRIEFYGYTKYMSKGGVVGFHDTNYHYGPAWLVHNIDPKEWDVTDYPGEFDRDFGIGFAIKK